MTNKEAYSAIQNINAKYEVLQNLNNADYNGWLRQLYSLYNVSIFSDNKAWEYLVDKIEEVKSKRTI